MKPAFSLPRTLFWLTLFFMSAQIIYFLLSQLLAGVLHVLATTTISWDIFTSRVVILPFPIGRHPDHRAASELGRDACYLAGLAKYDAAGEPHRPEKIL